MIAPPLFLPSTILAHARTIPGWLEDAEAELLMAAAAHVAHADRPATLVEVGSYHGRSTVVLAATLRALSPKSRLFAVDPHEGTIGAADTFLFQGASTFECFRANIEAAELGAWVHPICSPSHQVAWSGLIDLLFIDGLHDRENVARDFWHFEPFLAPGALALFHDYADYYPGVCEHVDLLVTEKGWCIEASAGTLRLLSRATT